MEVWKIIFLSKWLISRFHVNLPGSNHPNTGNTSHGASVSLEDENFQLLFFSQRFEKFTSTLTTRGSWLASDLRDPKLEEDFSEIPHFCQTKIPRKHQPPVVTMWGEMHGLITHWNLKQPLFNECFNWMIPNLYIRKWLFHQTSIYKWMFGVPGIYKGWFFVPLSYIVVDSWASNWKHLL